MSKSQIRKLRRGTEAGLLVNIPQEILIELGWEAGDVVIVKIKDKKVFLEKVML